MGLGKSSAEIAGLAGNGVSERGTSAGPPAVHRSQGCSAVGSRIRWPGPFVVIGKPGEIVHVGLAELGRTAQHEVQET